MMKIISVLLPLFFGLILISCYKEDDYLPSKLDRMNLLKLTASDTSLVADGVSFIYLYAELPLDIRDDKASITFNTNGGAFENGAKLITKTATIQAINGENKRIAKVKLISNTSISKVTVDATIGDITQSINISFVNIDYDKLITLTGSALKLPADGESFVTITAEQPIDVKDEYSSIVFTTTKGSFENGQKTITKSSLINLENGVYKRKAIVKLISSKHVETTDVEAAIKNSSKKINVSFERAYPDSVHITTTGLSISPGFNNFITFTTSLIRSVGTPSVSDTATLEAFDINNNRVGYFLNYNTLSDETGSISNRFMLGDQNYHGTIKILATSTNTVRQKIKDSIIVISP